MGNMLQPGVGEGPFELRNTPQRDRPYPLATGQDERIVAFSADGSSQRGLANAVAGASLPTAARQSASASLAHRPGVAGAILLHPGIAPTLVVAANWAALLSVFAVADRYISSQSLWPAVVLTANILIVVVLGVALAVVRRFAVESLYAERVGGMARAGLLATPLVGLVFCLSVANSAVPPLLITALVLILASGSAVHAVIRRGDAPRALARPARGQASLLSSPE